jgi:hypothetical protein
MDLKEQFKQTLRDCGVEVIDDMTQPVMLLRQSDFKFVLDGLDEDPTMIPILARSRKFDSISFEAIKEAVEAHKITRVSIMSVSEFVAGIQKTQYIVRGWFMYEDGSMTGRE